MARTIRAYERAHAKDAYVRCEYDHKTGNSLYEADGDKTPSTAGPHKTACGDTWICLCGNTCPSSGFYSCDAKGNEVEPTRKSWTSGLTFCGHCERLIRSRDGRVMGQRAKGARFLP